MNACNHQAEHRNLRVANIPGCKLATAAARTYAGYQPVLNACDLQKMAVQIHENLQFKFVKVLSVVKAKDDVVHLKVTSSFHGKNGDRIGQAPC